MRYKIDHSKAHHQGYHKTRCEDGGETPFRIGDEIELIFTCSSNDDAKASIIKWGLGVGEVVSFQSFMHSS